MNPEMKESFLIAVQNVITQCLIPVPAVPLMQLGEAVFMSYDSVESSSRTMDADERFCELWEAAGDIEWMPYLTDEMESAALVNNDSLHRLAGALSAYHQAQIPKLDETPVSVPHWESGTPIIGMMP